MLVFVLEDPCFLYFNILQKNSLIGETRFRNFAMELDFPCFILLEGNTASGILLGNRASGAFVCYRSELLELSYDLKGYVLGRWGSCLFVP